MSKKEKPLPTPPHKPFGTRKKFEDEEEHTELAADRIAQAAAEGKLDEFLKKEMPGNKYARNLANMMMGMTGMMPEAGVPAPSHAPESKEQPLPQESAPSAAEVPEDVRKAIQGGDVKGLMDLLRKEHQKRTPGGETETKPAEAEETAPSQPIDQPMIDKELIDAMIQIAKDNSVTMDWLILRAIKVYVEEYKKTGKL